MKMIFKNILILKIIVLVTLVNFSFIELENAFAAINKQINYQGRLLDNVGDPVSDGGISIVFKLYTAATFGTEVWSETQTATTTDGLFSVMLGSVSSFDDVNFNQTLYLGINVAGDGEMTPRKVLGSVPSAFEAERLDGITANQFFRNDIVNATNSATTSMFVQQTGSGDIARFVGASGVNALTITSAGRVAVGTTTPEARLAIQTTGTTDILNLFETDGTEVLTVLESGNVGIGTTTPNKKFVVGGDALITGALYDSSSLAGVNGYVLQTTGTSTKWVRTSITIGDDVFSGTSGSVLFVNASGKLAQNNGYFRYEPDAGRLLLNNPSNTVDVGTNSFTGGMSSGSSIFGSNSINGLLSGSSIFGNNNSLQANIGDDFATVIGNSNDLVYSDGSTVVGSMNVGGENQVNIFGTSNAVYGQYGSAFGTSNVVSSPFGNAFGYNNTANNSYALAFGISNVAGSGASAIGYANNASDLGTSIGYLNTASGRRSTAVGFRTQATAIGASVFGGGATGDTGNMINSTANSTMIGPSATSSIRILGSTGEVRLPFITATSTTATSTLPNIETTNARIIGRLSDGSNSVGVNGYILQTTGTSTKWVATSSLGISATPGGSNTQIQFNDGGIFAGDSDFAWNKTSNILTVNGSAVINSIESSGAIDYGYNLGLSSLGFFDNSANLNASYGLSQMTISDNANSEFVNVLPNYLNFGATTGSGGFGIRNNGGVIEFKNSGGSWSPITSLSSSTPITSADFFRYNHFENNLVDQFDPFRGAAISSGTLTTPLGTTMTTGQTPGVVRLRSSTTANGGYRITTPAGYLLLDDNMMFEGVVQLQTSAGLTTRLGFHDTVTSADAVDGAYFEITGTTARGKTSNNSARSSTASSYTISVGDTNWYRYRIALNSTASTVTYTIFNLSGTQLWTDTLSTNIPTAVGRETAAGIVVTDSSVSAKDMAHVDYMGIGTVAGYDSITSSGAGLWTMVGSDTYYNTGRVGIGTSAPQRALHVSISTDAAPVRFQDSNGYCEINPTSTTWTCTSDERLKENIVSIASTTPDLVERMMLLRPVSFEWKTDMTNTERVGFIAQEVEVLFPEFVTSDSETGLKSVSYGSFIPYIISVLQDISVKLEALTLAVEELASGGIQAVGGIIKNLTIGSSEEPAGITLFDEVSGEPYCLSVKNGNVVTKFGECSVVSGNSVSDPQVSIEPESVNNNEDFPEITTNIEDANDQDVVFIIDSEQSDGNLIGDDLVITEEEIPVEEVVEESSPEENSENQMTIETNSASGNTVLDIE